MYSSQSGLAQEHEPLVGDSGVKLQPHSHRPLFAAILKFNLYSLN